MKLSRKQEGFTIIEVMIVLAIAGLIMVIVFLAVPSLRRNSRNTARRADATHLIAAVSEHATNNGGAMPTTAANVTDLSATLGHYTTAQVSLSNCPLPGGGATACAAAYTPAIDAVRVITNARCPATVPATGAVTPDYGNRSAVVIFQVETTAGVQNQCLQS